MASSRCRRGDGVDRHDRHDRRTRVYAGLKFYEGSTWPWAGRAPQSRTPSPSAQCRQAEARESRRLVGQHADNQCSAPECGALVGTPRGATLGARTTTTSTAAATIRSADAGMDRRAGVRDRNRSLDAIR